MKLVFVIGYLQGGGAEHVLVTLCNLLSERGHDVTIIYNFHNKDYELSDKVRQIDFNTIEYNTFEGSTITRIYRKAANRIRDYRFFKKLIKVHRPDVITTFMRNRAEILYYVCKGRVPLVFSEHSSLLREPMTRLAKFVRYKLMPKAPAITVLTDYDKNLLQKETQNVYVMPNPLTVSPINKDEYDLLFEKRKNLFACGRFTEVKGIDNLIIAFSKIAKDFPEWDLDIAGKDIPGGHYSEFLLNLVKELGLESRVHFLGFSNNIQELMKKHSIYCLSSRSEGFSLTLIEAMASGMATVSYALSGPKEITTNEFDGLLVEDQNIEALAKGMKRLIEERNLRYELGLNAIESVKRFDENSIIDKWESLFRELINTRE